MRSFLSLLLLIGGCLFNCQADDQVGFFPSSGYFADSENAWTARLEAGYAAGHFIGLKENYGELGLFVAPEPQCEWIPFAELRGYRLDDGKWAASLGAGARWWSECSSNIWGANLFYDYRDTKLGSFNRIGIGAELFRECFDYRLNIYLPFKDKHSKRPYDKTDDYEDTEYAGTYFSWREKENFAFKGVDFEIARNLWECGDFWVEGGLGPYYYHQKEVSNVFGGQARMELAWMEYLSLELRASYDNEFKGNAQAKIMVFLPLFELLCGREVDPCTRRITQSVRRNGVIFTKNDSFWDRNY